MLYVVVAVSELVDTREGFVKAPVLGPARRVRLVRLSRTADIDKSASDFLRKS